MIRLFVAVPIPEELRRRMAMLATGVQGARWSPEENMHLTLCFIGEVTEDRLPDIAIQLDRVNCAPFALRLSGAGHFETKGRVRALWIGVEGNPQLAALQERVSAALGRAGVAPDKRRFLPHVTIGRMKGVAPGAVEGWLRANTLFRAMPFTVDRFVLFRSQPGQGGSHYTPLHEVELEGAAPARE
jgi:RNA 2',3'-cyclic 3'-phosphodiesterase